MSRVSFGTCLRVAAAAGISLLLTPVSCGGRSYQPTAAGSATPATTAARATTDRATESVSPPPSPPPASQPPLAGKDFRDEVSQLFRVAACRGQAELPANLSPAAADKHCADLTLAIEGYRKKWLVKAEPFLRRLVPVGLPGAVVYPFGGGDLLTALATFPEAVEFTTISLEGAGDIRQFAGLSAKQLEKDLGRTSRVLARLLKAAFSATKELNDAYNTALPGQLVVVLGALAVFDYEPVSLRYFTIEEDGSLHYLTAEELAAGDPPDPGAGLDDRHPEAKRKPKKQKRELAVSTFTNVELQFRKLGGGELKVYRHIAFDLGDRRMRKRPELLRHLEAKGRVTAMTKAASHLLWLDSFSIIRQYLLDHVEWMISDSTGIPPRVAAAAGFEQLTWGKFNGVYFPHRASPVEQQMIDLWKKNPKRQLDFRYGYFDIKHHNHLMVTRRKL